MASPNPYLDSRRAAPTVEWRRETRPVQRIGSGETGTDRSTRSPGRGALTRLCVLPLTLLLGALPGGAQEETPCEPQWTFPVPFYQSVAWSPDGARLAFSAVTTSWDDGYGIFVVGSDGSGLERIDTGDAEALYPVFSPDGSRIAFSSRRGDNSDVAIVPLGGGAEARLTELPANDGYPSWSPDGSRIAFHSNRDGNYEIYVMQADGSHPVRLTDDPADDYNPAWSPDGGRIVFESDRDGDEEDEIYLIDPDGSHVARVTAPGVFPTWSPDGRRILFSWHGLYSIAVDGGERAPLLADAVYGAWSPDGATIAAAATEYDADCKDHHSLLLLAPDGTRRKKLQP